MIKYNALSKVVELGSISKAAEALGYSQPGLSHILTAFEDEVGFPLITKTKRTIEPTANGARVLEYAEKIIQLENAMKVEIELLTNVHSGIVRIGAPNSMLVGFVTDVTREFNHRYPTSEFNIQEACLEDVAKDLQECRIDVGFLTDIAAKPYKFFPLFEDKIVLAVNEESPLAKFDKIPLKELKGVPVIMQAKGWDDISQYVMERAPFKLNARYFSKSDFACLAMVASGIGCYIMSELQECLLPEGVVIREFEENITRNIGVAVKTTKNMPQIHRTFIDLTKELMEE